MRRPSFFIEDKLVRVASNVQPPASLSLWLEA